METNIKQTNILALQKSIEQLTKEKEMLSNKLEEASQTKQSLTRYCNDLEEELSLFKEKESKLSRLFELSFNAIMFINTNGEILDCNPACLTLFDYKYKREFIGKAPFDITASSDIERTHKMFKKVVEDDFNIRLEKRFVTQKGKEFPAIIQASKLDSKSNIIVAIVQDLSAQHKREQNNLDRIKLLSKMAFLNQKFAKSKTLIQLNRSLCRYLLNFSEAYEVWIIDNPKSSGAANAKSYLVNNDNKASLKELNVHFSNDELEHLKKLYLFEGPIELGVRDKLNFKFSKRINEVKYQIVIIVKLEKHKDIIICLNYLNSANENKSDKEYFTYAYPQIKSAYEKLDFYEQLVANEARYRALTENLNDIIIIRNMQGQYTYVSSSIRRYNIEPDEIIGKTMVNIINPNDIPIAERAIRKILEMPGSSETLNSIRIELNNEQFVVDLIVTNLLHLRSVKGIVICVQDITDKVEVIRQIHESEEKYSALLENANDGICLMKSDQIVYSNKMLNSMFGADNIDVIDKVPSDFSPEFQPNGIDSKEYAQTITVKALTEKVQSFEWVFKRLDGSTFEGQVSLSKIELLDGKYLMAIIRDTSDIKKAYRKLEQSEAKLSNIFESMNDGVYLSTLDCDIQYTNKTMQDQALVPLIGKKCFQEIYGFGEACKWCKRSDLVENECKIIDIYNPKTKRHYQVSKSLIKDVEGNSAVLHISRDVTEIKQSQELIKQSEEKFRNIFNSSNDAIFITDLSGNFKELNELASKRTGVSKKEFLRKNILEALEYSDGNDIENYIKSIIKKGSAMAEIQYINKSGREIFTEVSGKIINYLGNKSILHVSRDITLRKEIGRKILEAQIKTEENERSRFARDLHDGIGPYLSATKFFLNTISREEDLQERDLIINKAKDSIDEIISNVKEISNNISPHVLKNFGLIAALKAFRKKTIKSDVDIIINSNIDSERFSENIEISIFRILMELINNTFKYAKADKIILSLILADNKLLVDYVDDGKGFDVQATLNEPKGMGLNNIVNRVNALKGEYKFNCDNGKGFGFKALFKLI